MNLEGRKFHFARDDDGHIYAEYEIETETANVREVRPSVFASQQSTEEGRELCLDENDKVIINYFAMLLRFYHISGGSYLAYKVLTAVRYYANSGECFSNAEEDSVCGGVCATCRDA